MLRLPRNVKTCVVYSLGVILLLLISGSMIWRSASKQCLSTLPHENTWQSSSMQSNTVPQDPRATERLPDSLTKLYDGVETFVMFIGYARSGHSLVGAILDAHPEIVVPHEYDILCEWDTYRKAKLKRLGAQKYLLFHQLHALSTFQAMFGIRASKPVYMNGHIYSYNVPGGWQGTHNGKLKVIGDKKGGNTTVQLSKNISNFKILEEIQKTVDIPLKFVHVTRNPFDNIATQMLFFLHARKITKDHGKTKIDKKKSLSRNIRAYFKSVEANERVRQLYGDTVLDILGHELLLNPRETMNKLCRFLGVTCYEDYLSVVEKVLHVKPSLTRHSLVWTQDQIDWVHREIKKYSFLHSYSFDSEY